MVEKRPGVEKRPNDGEGKPKKSNHCNRLMHIGALLISTIGLGILICGYSILGAFMFQILESDVEEEALFDIKKMRKHFITKLHNVTPYDWEKETDEILVTFQSQVFLATKKGEWNGEEEANEHNRWAFPQALLFCITVITTIGYGNIAPVTVGGKVATIFYGFLGIPIALLFLANVGSMMGDFIRALVKFRCCSCCRENPTNGLVRSPKRNMNANSRHSMRSHVIDETERNEDMPFDETLYGQMSSKRNLNKESKVSTSPSVLQSGPPKVIRETPLKRRRQELKNVHVPVKITLLIVLLYLLFGAAMFSIWQKDWTFLDACYFCFITFSTIGFGDYVFGQTALAEDHRKLMVCVIYLVLGLSIMAMAFDLLKESVKATAQNCFQKVISYTSKF